MSPKFPMTTIVQDAAATLADRRAASVGRGGPGIVEHSLRVMPCTVGCAQDGTGGDEVFRIAHGLSSAPHVVKVMRIQEPRQNTREYAGVTINTCAPVSDARYSYFSIGIAPAVSLKTGHVMSGATDNEDWDSCWTSESQSRSAIVSGGGNVGDSDAIVADALVAAQRRVSFRAVAAKTINWAVFYGLPDNTVITVRVYSAVLAGLLDGENPKIVGPSLGHPAPPLG